MSVRRLRGQLRAFREEIASHGPQPGDMIVVEAPPDMSRGCRTCSDNFSIAELVNSIPPSSSVGVPFPARRRKSRHG